MRTYIRGHAGWTLAVGLFFALATVATAQTMMEMNAAMNINNTLTGQSQGGGYVPRFAPGGFPGAPGSTPFAPQMPMGMFPGAMMGMVPGMPAPMPAAPAAPPINRILVLTGERVKCHVMTDMLLEDIHYEYRPESEKSEYFDDGTHGDLQANDNIYTRYSERNDVLSAEANRLKVLYLRMLELCEETNPIEFFRIPVATEEPLSTLPRLSDEERDRDETFLRHWHSQFLRLYRQDPEDPMSDFYPIFIPSPPRPPDTPAPPNDQFNPNAYALDTAIQQIVDRAVSPAVEEPMNYQTTTGRWSRSSSRGEGGGGGSGRSTYTGDRWGQLRQDARTYGASYGMQTSRYFR